MKRWSSLRQLIFVVACLFLVAVVAYECSQSPALANQFATKASSPTEAMTGDPPPPWYEDDPYPMPDPSNTVTATPTDTPTPTNTLTPTITATSTQGPTPTPYEMYLPIVLVQIKSRLMGFVNPTLALSGKMDRVYYPQWWLSSLDWPEIESTPGVYDYDPTVDANMELLDEADISVMMTVRGAPLWAARVSGYECSGPGTAYVDDWVDWILDMIDRYPAIRAIGVMNEATIVIPTPAPFWADCYGDDVSAYVDLLEALDAALPDNILIIAGQAENGQALNSFYEYIIENGVEYYDGFSYHLYRDWGTAVPVATRIASANEYIADVRASVPVTREVWMTEFNLLDPSYTCSSSYQTDRATFLSSIWSTNKNVLDNHGVYTLWGEGWECCDIWNTSAWSWWATAVPQTNWK